MDKSRSEHILELSRELLDDIELNRLSAEALLLKASRLARWVGSEEIKYWIGLELKGYNGSNEVSLKYMGKTGRWTNKEEKKGYWGPLSQQESAIEAEHIKLRSISTPDTSGDYGFSVMEMYQRQLLATTNYISTLSAIKSKVLAHLHSFVTDIYYEKEFESLSESIFEKYKSDIDTLVAEHAGDVLEQIPAVMARLAEGDQESISQALTTVRRIIDSFADSIFPPTDETINIGGNEISLGANRHKNRINAFVHQRLESQSRKSKIRQNLSNLYDRVSTGVHNDVTAEEARSLFLNTYLLLGEILHIAELKDA